MAFDRDKLNALKMPADDDLHGSGGSGWMLAVFFLLITGAVGLWWYRKEHAPSVKTVEVQSVAQKLNAVGETVLNASGYVSARRKATVSAKITGKLTAVLIEEGQAVEEGDVLARLEQSNINAELALAEAEVPARQAAIEQTEVRIEEARKDLGRTQSLVSSGALGSAAQDRDQAALDALLAQKKQQQSQVLVAQKQVAVLRQQLDDTIIRAPFSGIVISKDAQPGEIISPVSAGGSFTRTGIGTIVDMASLEIEVDVNESYINRVSPGQPITAVLDAYPEWEIPAKVIAVVPTADRQKATVRVRIGFDQLDPKILPDMSVKVAFIEEKPPETEVAEINLRVVPESAIRRENGREYLFVVKNGNLERRTVQVAERRDGKVYIKAGVDQGEKVVVESSQPLSNGGIRVNEENK